MERSKDTLLKSPPPCNAPTSSPGYVHPPITTLPQRMRSQCEWYLNASRSPPKRRLVSTDIQEHALALRETCPLRILFETFLPQISRREGEGDMSPLNPLPIPIAIKQAQLSPAHEINAQQTPTPILGSKTQSPFNHLPSYFIPSSPTSLLFGPAPSEKSAFD